MIPNLREENFTTKEEGNTVDSKSSKVSTIPSTSTPGSRLRDPRIVRVSRTLGGKDRHSKVCTVRGLRDRRIRLSVPTAIQLYDLQDRLGLTQPSKVVDWLLNVAEQEINELPPLQIPPGCFGLDHHQQMLMCHDHAGASSQSNEFDQLKVQNNVANNWDESFGICKPNFWNLDNAMKDKSKKIATETGEEENDQKNGEDISSINFFPGVIHTSFRNNPNMYNSFYSLKPSNFPLPQMGREDIQNFNDVPSPPTTLPQVLVCPPYFPSHVGVSSQFDPKQVNHFQMLSASGTSQSPLSNSLAAPTFYSLGQAMIPLHLNMGLKRFGSEESGGSQPNNNGEFSSN